MHPDIEQTLVIEFDELFALGDRIRQVADSARARLLSAGLNEPMEAEVFDRDLELRGAGNSHLLMRLSSYQLEITGAPPQLQIHLAAAILLDEAGAFRLTSVEAGYALTLKARGNRTLNMVAQAFSPIEAEGDEPMLDRRFSLTWDWGTATTGFSFHAGDVEDRELFLSFKAREGYMSLPELQSGFWMASQATRFEGLVARTLRQVGWNV